MNKHNGIVICFVLASLLFSGFGLTNPLAEWRMDESSWNGVFAEVLDNSGNSRHGTARNGLTTQQGVLCRGGFFRGEGFNADPFNTYYPAQYYIEVPGSSALSPHVVAVGAAITLSGWFNTQRTDIVQTLIHKGDGGNTQDYRIFLQNNRLNIQFYNLNGGSETRVLNYAIQTNINYFFAVSARRQVSGSRQDLYLQVELYGQQSDTPLISGSTVIENFNIAGKNTSGNIFIGATKFGTDNITNYFDGLIDEVRIYSGVRTVQQNLADKNLTRSCPGALRCLSENFENQTEFNRIWQILTQSGSFTPQLNNGTLRLTQSTNQATLVSLRRIFPAAENFVQIEFDFNAYAGNLFNGSQGGDGVTVVLSDAEAPLRAGSFGGALGYAQRNDGTPGFGGGWLGIGLDVYGNFSIANEGKVGGFASNTSINQTRNRVVVRGSAQSNYAYITASAQLSPALSIAGTNRGPGHRYRITIDSRQPGTAMLLVERNTGNGFVTVIPSRNVAADLAGTQGNVPANLRLSFTGSTGGAFNIHELDNVVVCAARSSGGIVLDHIRLQHAATNVSCVDATLELTACLNADCSQVLSEPGSVRLQSSGGVFIGGAVSNVSGSNATITFTNGQAAAGLRWAQTGIAEINILTSTPELANFGDLRCFVGATRSNCQIQFTGAGLIFVDPADNISPLPHGHAGLTYNGRLRAVQTNTTTGACEARASGSKIVQLGVECINPAACVTGQSFQVNGNNIAFNADATSTNRTATSLLFNDSGAANFTYRYTDTGRVRMHATLPLPADADGPALSLVGASNAFVSKPHTIRIVEVTALNPSRANPATTNTGQGFAAAGEPFRVVMESLNAQQLITPNFGMETNPTPRQRVRLEYLDLLYPQPGLGSASLLNVAGNFSLISNNSGRMSNNEVRWLEAGTIRVRGAIPQNNYLGAGDVLVKEALTIGRFYPQGFRLTDAQVSNTCNTYSYMQQPTVELGYQLQAENAAGTVLQNYSSDRYTGTAQFAVVAKDNETLNLGSRLVVNTTNWQNGIYQINQTDALFNRLVSAAPDGPFRQLQLGLQLGYEVDNRPLLNSNFNAGVAGVCTTNCNAIQLGNSLDMRYGRLVLENAFGSEFDDLPLTLRAEYWDGQRFITNSADNCSLSAPVSLNRLAGSVTPAILGEALPLNTGVSRPLSLLLNAPAVVGSATYEYIAPPWLSYNWDRPAVWSDDCAALDSATSSIKTPNPWACMIFGRYRGNPRLIFWREQ